MISQPSYQPTIAYYTDINPLLKLGTNNIINRTLKANTCSVSWYAALS
jgi:hypothetical protein